MSSEQKPIIEKRFVVQMFNCDTDKENPVLDSIGITCPDAKSAEKLYDLIKKVAELLTFKEML